MTRWVTVNRQTSALRPERERALAVRGVLQPQEGVTPHPLHGLAFGDLLACHLEDNSVADLDGVVCEPFVEPAQ